ncbi:MAG: mechanosensitive ion channel family protein, partial [Desulfopila sp.]
IMLLATLELPQVLMLLFVFITSVATFVLYLIHLRTPVHSTPQKVLRNFWGVLPATVIIFAGVGYDQLAIFTFSTVISSIGACLVIWMLFHLISGFLELVLRVLPFPLILDNIPVIVKSIQPFLAIFHILLTVAILTVTWDIFPSTEAALATIYSAGPDIAGLQISPGLLISFFIVLYGAVLFSRAIQALLLSVVLPRYSTGKGVQISITRLVHYGILTIGFLIMLKVLGFQMQQLTILGGALGVGIGFGLQAIVNNFVGGLILLFERPIKVGDTIEVGPQLGEVKKLGLRSTIIQTFDNSEIVVPNADLVTGQVTNWTLSERRVRVKILVGVAYGSNVEKVLEILLACANAHPLVLSTPAPTALFVAFGASSLDFQLRVWIPEYNDFMTATSELNQAVESEFAFHGIEIPFPQTDLHLRTVSETAAMALAPTAEKTARPTPQPTAPSTPTAATQPQSEQGEEKDGRARSILS